MLAVVEPKQHPVCHPETKLSGVRSGERGGQVSGLLPPTHFLAKFRSIKFRPKCGVNIRSRFIFLEWRVVRNVFVSQITMVISPTYLGLRWSRGSVLAFSTQVRGFKSGRSRRIFKKILSTPSFGGELKPSVPCRRFAACKRSLNGVEVVISAKLPDKIIAHSSTFRR